MGHSTLPLIGGQNEIYRLLIGVKLDNLSRIVHMPQPKLKKCRFKKLSRGIKGSVGLIFINRAIKTYNVQILFKLKQCGKIQFVC